MMKDVRKSFGTFWVRSFLQGVIFEDFHEKHGFPGFLETILRQFTAQLRSSAFASRCAFCFFACCALCLWVDSVAVKGRVLRTPLGHDLCSYNGRADSGMGVGSSSSICRLYY